MRYLHQYTGTARLARARQQIGERLEAWSAQWRVEHGRVDHAGDPLKLAFHGDADALPEHGHCLRDAQGDVYLQASDESWPALLFGTHKLPDDDIRRALVEQARTALLRLVAGGTGTVETLTAAPAAGKARIGVEMACGGACVQLLVDASRFDGALPPVPRPVLSLRDEAVGNSTVTLQLGLSLAQLGVEELRHLQPGAVIRTGHPLHRPLQLGTPEQPAVLAAFLGRQDGRLAVRIAPSS